MSKEEYLETLQNGTDSQQAKIDCLNYFIDNYPVLINTPFGGKMWTGLDISVIGGNPELINRAFASLQSRIEEFKND